MTYATVDRRNLDSAKPADSDKDLFITVLLMAAGILIQRHMDMQFGFVMVRSQFICLVQVALAVVTHTM